MIAIVLMIIVVIAIENRYLHGSYSYQSWNHSETYLTGDSNQLPWHNWLRSLQATWSDVAGEGHQRRWVL